jgi:hypothetical protein
MTGRRLLSTNLIYKLLEPKDGYEISVNGSLGTHRRQVQHGFDRIAILQLALSIIGWGSLSFVLSEHLKTRSVKYLSAIILMAFAFTPQIADWDSILMSESLSFSLFALQLALLINLVFLIDREQTPKISTYFAGWVITFFVWSFLRDTNLFAAIITTGMVAVLFFSTKFQKNGYLYTAFFFTIGIFVLGLLTSSNSTRALVQIKNIYRDDILVYPTRVYILKKLGMPEPGSADYDTWFQENSSKTLVKFMIQHPGYPTFKIIKDFPSSFSEIKQTYFHAPEQYQVREILMQIGDALHPESTTPFLMDILLLFGLAILALRNKTSSSQIWIWLGFWLFLTASFILIPTILGDSWALNRHALLPTTIYRLFMWMFILVIMDIAIDQNSKQIDPPAQG